MAGDESRRPLVSPEPLAHEFLPRRDPIATRAETPPRGSGRKFRSRTSSAHPPYGGGAAGAANWPALRDVRVCRREMGPSDRTHESSMTQGDTQ